MPTCGFRERLVGLIAGVLLCFALTPLAVPGARWLRPLAWSYTVIHLFNAMGHTVSTILGHTVATMTFARPARGFYSSPLLFIGAVGLGMILIGTSPSSRRPVSAGGLPASPQPSSEPGVGPSNIDSRIDAAGPSGFLSASRFAMTAP